MPHTKRRGSKKQKTVRKLSAETNRGPRSLSPVEVALYGPRPETPTELFIVHGSGVYSVRKDQLVSLRPHVDPTVAEYMRSSEGRQLLVINAGKPTATDPQAGMIFRNHQFTPKPEELNEVEWRAPNNETIELASEFVNPNNLSRHINPHPYCSSADVIARYAGGEALSPTGSGLFVILFLNNGSLQFAPSPPAGEDGCPVYMAQRRDIASNLSKLFLVCPNHATTPAATLAAAVKVTPPVLQGEPPTETPTKSVSGTVLLACLASIISDKSDGAPGATYQPSISGYHDRCRLHVLSPAHVLKIRQLVYHFRLDMHFPLLCDKSLIADADVLLELWRLQCINAIGLPPFGTMTPEWLKQRAEVNFGTPWVLHCDLAHPKGEVDNEGRPVLLPLLRNGAEELNGSPWLHLDEKNAATEHGHNLQIALARVAGTTPKKRPLPINDDHLDATKFKRVISEMRVELKEAKQKISHLNTKYKRLETSVRKITTLLEDCN